MLLQTVATHSSFCSLWHCCKLGNIFEVLPLLHTKYFRKTYLLVRIVALLFYCALSVSLTAVPSVKSVNGYLLPGWAFLQSGNTGVTFSHLQTRTQPQDVSKVLRKTHLKCIKHHKHLTEEQAAFKLYAFKFVWSTEHKACLMFRKTGIVHNSTVVHLYLTIVPCDKINIDNNKKLRTFVLNMN